MSSIRATQLNSSSQNHADELSLRPLLEEVKKRCSEHLINTVLADDDNSGWKAFTNVFGSVEHHLLCKWYITRALRRKLSKLAPKTEVKNELYRALLVLLEEKDPLRFEMLMNGFLSMCNEKSPNLGEYFQVNYMDRAKQWAMSYRSFEHANTDTNMYEESFHNVLKTYYIERKPNKRVVDLKNVLLLTYEEDTRDISEKRFTQQNIRLLTITQGIQEEWPLSMKI